MSALPSLSVIASARAKHPDSPMPVADIQVAMERARVVYGFRGALTVYYDPNAESGGDFQSHGCFSPIYKGYWITEDHNYRMKHDDMDSALRDALGRL